MYWYRKAAAQGRISCHLQYRILLRRRDRVVKNDQEAVKYYRIAAELGNAFAQNSLGYCFEDRNWR